MPVVSEETTVGPYRVSLARPDDIVFPLPGVLVLHEMFGLNDDMRRITRRFAENGFVAMAPDLYSRGNKAACLTRVLMDLGYGARGETLDDLVRLRMHLAGRDDVDHERMGVVGFCMGGSFALMLATTGEVAAAAVNYGAVPKDRSQLDGVCPVVASYGARDRLFVKQGKRLEEHLAALGVPHDVKIYEDTGHSFINKDNIPWWMAKVPSPLHAKYSEAEAEDAWARMFAFFAQHL